MTYKGNQKSDQGENRARNYRHEIKRRQIGRSGQRKREEVEGKLTERMSQNLIMFASMETTWASQVEFTSVCVSVCASCSLI